MLEFCTRSQTSSARLRNLNEVRLHKVFVMQSEPAIATQVCQEFDTARFNFTKIPQKEILFHLDETASTARFEHKAMMGQSPNLVLINVSPIEYGHVLLVPRVLDCLPQVSTLSLDVSSPSSRLCNESECLLYLCMAQGIVHFAYLIWLAIFESCKCILLKNELS